MIPLNSDGPGAPRRTFSPDVKQELASALRDYDANTGAGEETLRGALRRAALDARERELGPEDLVLALKAIVVELSEPRSQSPQAREKAYSMALRAMLVAYFGESKGQAE
jgi:hypothetical protein